MDSSLSGGLQTQKSPYLPESGWRALLRRHRIRPDRKLGQNFLFNRHHLEKVVAAAEIDGRTAIVEIGAGIGSLTRPLAAAAGKVAAIEFDRRLLPALLEATAGFGNVQVKQGDVLEIDLPALVGTESYLVVANIPYNITSAVLRQMVESTPPPVRAILTVQKELAERVVAPAGEMSLLSLSVQLFGFPEIVATLPAAAFWPKPKVDSAILRVGGLQRAELDTRLSAAIFHVARAGFSQRRKQLHNSLAAGLDISDEVVDELLRAAGVDRQRRPQSLSIEDWHRLGEAWLNLNELG